MGWYRAHLVVKGLFVFVTGILVRIVVREGRFLEGLAIRLWSR